MKTGYAIIIVSVAVYACAYFLGVRALVVTSGSMEPVLPVGSFVIVTPKSGGYAVGDVITYKVQSDRLLTHRIVRALPLDNSHIFYTRGDANRGDDILPVSEKDVLGEVVVTLPKIGTMVANPLFAIYFLYLPLGVLFGQLAKKLTVYESESKKF